MEINLNNDLYIESGNTIGVQDIPQNEGSAVLGDVACRVCSLTSLTLSAVYGIAKLDSADLNIEEPKDYTFIFSGTPITAYVYARSNGTTGGTYFNLGKVNTTGFTYSKSAMSYCVSAYGYTSKTGRATVAKLTSATTISYTLTKTSTSSPYTFTFTGSPTSVGIGYRGLGTTNGYIWTTAKTISTVAYSAIQYTISADGYSSQSSLAYANQSTSSKTISYALDEAATIYYGVRFLISPTAATPTIFYGASLGSVTANSMYANAATKSSNYWIFDIQWQYPNMYYQIVAPRYTTITGSTATLADDTVVKTIILTQTGYTYTYSINVSPSAATFEYGEDDSCSESDFYSETVNNNGASKTYVIKTNYSPLYYDAFLDGYDEETGSITGNSGETVTKVISLPKTKYEYWILVEDKKTGSAISGATIGKVVVGFSGETVTNSYGVAYIYAYDTIPQVSVSAPYRGTQLITMSSTLTPRGTYGTFYGASVQITNVFDIPYYYKVCAKLLEQGSRYNSIISGVSFSCSGASTSVSVLTTDVGTGMAIFTSEDSTIWVQASKSGHQITSSSINVTDTTLSSNYAMITLYMYYDYYRYLSVSQIMMSNSKGQYGCCCGVGITHNKSGNQEDKIVSGGTLIDLEASDKGSSVTLEFFHRGADVIEEQITIPVRTVTSPIFTTGLIIPFTGSNKTLTANDLESISLDEEEGWANGGSINYSLRGVKDDDASAVGTGWGRYRGEFLTAVTATDQVVLESDVDFYMFLPDE